LIFGIIGVSAEEVFPDIPYSNYVAYTQNSTDFVFVPDSSNTYFYVENNGSGYSCIKASGGGTTYHWNGSSWEVQGVMTTVPVIIIGATSGTDYTYLACSSNIYTSSAKTSVFFSKALVTQAQALKTFTTQFGNNSLILSIVGVVILSAFLVVLLVPRLIHLFL
jgi:hypothetical protein